MKIFVKKTLAITIAAAFILNILSPLNVIQAAKNYTDENILPASFPQESEPTPEYIEPIQEVVIPTTYNVSGRKFFDANGNSNFDNDEYGLQGWRIVGAQYVTEVNVDSANINGIDTIPLLAGEYIIMASGTWYGGDEFSQDRFDAEYNSQDNWNTYSNGPILYHENQGDLMINNEWINWGEYNPNHVYTTAYTLGSAQSMNFSLFDGFIPGNTKNPEWYQDNIGSLNVKVFRIIANSYTNSNGEYSMDFDIHGGQVNIFEVLQNGWKQTFPHSTYYVGVSGESTNLNFGNTIVNDLLPSVEIVASSTTSIETAITLTANITSQGNAPATIVKWEGDFAGCTGNAMSVMTPSTPGTYTCGVIIKDADGDLAYATATVTVSAKSVTPPTTPTNKIPTVVLFGNYPATNSAGIIYVPANTNFSVTGSLYAHGDAPYTFAFSGICSGGYDTSNSFAVSNMLNLNPGTYVCNVQVKDANGDISNASVKIVAQGAGTTSNGTGNIGTGASTSNNTDASSDDTTDSDGDILGAASRCVETNYARGYVFIDANGNNERQVNETGVAGVLLTISYEITDEDGNTVVKREDVVTDATGMWELELCPGVYNIEMDTDQLSDNMTLESEESFEFEVLENEDKADVNFVITEAAEEAVNFWYFAIILLIIALLTAGYLIFDRNKEETKA